MGALIIQRPLSVMVEEGENITLKCKTGGVPTPIVTWQKAFSWVPKKKTAVKNLESYNTQNRKSRWRDVCVYCKESPWTRYRNRTGDRDRQT